ncbi:MAG TPA: S1 family peptidase [Polyangiaceae bacterium]
MKVRAGVGLLLALTTAGCGEPAEAERQTLAIRGGEAAPEAEQVVALVNFAGGQCTGVPIGPELVLTARHCIGATNETSSQVDCEKTAFVDPDSAGAMFVLLTPTITDDPEDYRAVESVHVPPGVDASLCGNDVALVRLEERLPVAPLIPRVDVPALAGEPYTAYGFGDDEGTEGPGVRRRLTGLSVACVAPACADAEVRATEWLGSDGVCSGDSGGPALDVQGRILGVASRGYSGCRSPIYGAVHAFGGWLKQETLRAAQARGDEPPNWARGFSTDPRYHYEVGARCSDDEQCASGHCGERGLCTRECGPQGPCPDAYVCEEVTGLCEKAPSSASSGPEASCALSAPSAKRSSYAAVALGLFALLGMRRFERRVRRAHHTSG